MIEIEDGLEIPEREIEFRTSTSSGPGGQNVNRVETRVTLLFDVGASETLDEEQKEKVRDHLATRINKAGVLRVTSQRHRTQSANRKAAEAKFADLIAQALEEEKKRKRTRPTKASKRRRLKKKRRRGEIKRLRKPPKRGDY